jgi:hypothetical protein
MDAVVWLDCYLYSIDYYCRKMPFIVVDYVERCKFLVFKLLHVLSHADKKLVLK